MAEGAKQLKWEFDWTERDPEKGRERFCKQFVPKCQEGEGTTQTKQLPRTRERRPGNPNLERMTRVDMWA